MSPSKPPSQGAFIILWTSLVLVAGVAAYLIFQLHEMDKRHAADIKKLREDLSSAEGRLYGAEKTVRALQLEVGLVRLQLDSFFEIKQDSSGAVLVRKSDKAGQPRLE